MVSVGDKICIRAGKDGKEYGTISGSPAVGDKIRSDQGVKGYSVSHKSGTPQVGSPVLINHEKSGVQTGLVSGGLIPWGMAIEFTNGSIFYRDLICPDNVRQGTVIGVRRQLSSSPIVTNSTYYHEFYQRGNEYYLYCIPHDESYTPDEDRDLILSEKITLPEDVIEFTIPDVYLYVPVSLYIDEPDGSIVLTYRPVIISTTHAVLHPISPGNVGISVENTGTTITLPENAPLTEGVYTGYDIEITNHYARFDTTELRDAYFNANPLKLFEGMQVIIDTDPKQLFKYVSEFWSDVTPDPFTEVQRREISGYSDRIVTVAIDLDYIPPEGCAYKILPKYRYFYLVGYILAEFKADPSMYVLSYYDYNTILYAGEDFYWRYYVHPRFHAILPERERFIKFDVFTDEGDTIFTQDLSADMSTLLDPTTYVDGKFKLGFDPPDSYDPDWNPDGNYYMDFSHVRNSGVHATGIRACTSRDSSGEELIHLAITYFDGGLLEPQLRVKILSQSSPGGGLSEVYDYEVGDPADVPNCITSFIVDTSGDEFQYITTVRLQSSGLEYCHLNGSCIYEPNTFGSDEITSYVVQIIQNNAGIEYPIFRDHRFISEDERDDYFDENPDELVTNLIIELNSEIFRNDSGNWVECNSNFLFIINTHRPGTPSYTIYTPYLAELVNGDLQLLSTPIFDGCYYGFIYVCKSMMFRFFTPSVYNNTNAGLLALNDPLANPFDGELINLRGLVSCHIGYYPVSEMVIIRNGCVSMIGEINGFTTDPSPLILFGDLHGATRFQCFGGDYPLSSMGINYGKKYITLTPIED